MAHFAVGIPARLNSSRLHQKLLLDLGGKPIIQRTYEQALASDAAIVTVVTDSEEIASVVMSFGGRVLISRRPHKSGTSRLAEYASEISSGLSTIVNVQGDEPFVDPQLIVRVAEAVEGRSDYCFKMSTAVTSIDRIQMSRPECVKAVVANLFHPVRQPRAVYFTRSPLPNALLHVGIYGFWKDFLIEYANSQESPLAAVESLEQMKAIEMGVSIHATYAEHSPRGVDTLEDYLLAKMEIGNDGKALAKETPKADIEVI